MFLFSWGKRLCIVLGRTGVVSAGCQFKLRVPLKWMNEFEIATAICWGPAVVDRSLFVIWCRVMVTGGRVAG